MSIFVVAIIACEAEKPLSPDTTLERVRRAWSADQHGVWALDWSVAPINGPVVFELWQAGPRYRYEILESPVPALIGQTLVSDGQRSWQYNRLDLPAIFEPTEAGLSPLTDALRLIEDSLATSPVRAVQTETQISLRPAQKISMTFSNGEILTMWLDSETATPLKISFIRARETMTLQARQSEWLKNPSDKLFSVGDWLR